MKENNEATISFELFGDSYNSDRIAWGASDLSSNLNGPTPLVLILLFLCGDRIIFRKPTHC
jgi:hypothetical protein